MPFSVENHSPFPHFAFIKTGPDGDDFHVLAVRATFEWVHQGTMTLAREQSPIVVADQFHGPADEGDLRLETDLVIGKPRADVLVLGHAYAPAGVAATWIARVRIGSLSKAIRLYGPRYWEHGAMGFRLTEPKAIERIPLTYRFAYGGSRKRTTAGGVEEDVFEANPIGIGYQGRFPVKEALFPAPQFESVNAPIRSLSDRPAPEGFGPIARAWMPRRARSGSLTREFVHANPCRMPPDFDWEFYNSANPDLMYEGFLEGTEAIETDGLFPEVRSTSQLPGYRAMAVAFLESGPAFPVEPKLDTIALDIDLRRVHATWRLTLPVRLGMNALVLGFAMPGPRSAGRDLYPLRRKA